MEEEAFFRSKFPQAIRLSWDEVEDLLWTIFLSIRESGFDPDVIVGVSRGGLAPARILVDYLQKKYICTLQMGHWDGNAQFTERPSLIYPLPEVDLTHKRILVVDDVSDEGGTMEEVVSYLRPKVGEIRSAVIVSKSDSCFRADFCPKIMDDWRWVFFPWSKHEDLVAFVEKLLQLTGGASIEDIIRILGEAMQVDFACDEIEKVLFDMLSAGEISEDGNKVWTLI